MFCILTTIAMIHIQIYAEHNQTQYTNFNERTNTLLYKNISLKLYSRKGDVGCVWEMSWRQGQTAILTPSSSSTIAAILSHGNWVAQPWVTEGRKPSVCKLILMLASYLQLTRTVCALVILLFNVYLLPLFFHLFTQVHLLIDGSVEGQYITHVDRNTKCTSIRFNYTSNTYRYWISISRLNSKIIFFF